MEDRNFTGDDNTTDYTDAELDARDDERDSFIASPPDEDFEGAIDRAIQGKREDAAADAVARSLAWGLDRALNGRRFDLVYPERRTVTGDWLIGQAKDYLATEYMRRNPEADDAAVEENARVRTVDLAIEILEDAGVVTLAR